MGGTAWIGLRDWSLPSPADRERIMVLDAVRIGCREGCRAEALRRAPAGDWVVRVQARTGALCLLVDPQSAAADPGRGLVGARRVRLAACRD